MATRLGMNAKLYLNTGSHGSPSWMLVNNVKDVTLSLETAEADVTTRANAGWRATVGTLKDASIEFQMVWDSNDPSFNAIQGAFFSNSPIEVAVMDGDMQNTGSQGLRATCVVLSFSRSEALEEAITVDVSLKPTYAEHAPQWITGA